MGDEADQAAIVTKLQKLPLFRGTKVDTLSTLSWVESVDRQKAANDWSEENTARYAVEALREKAAEWYRAAREEETVAVAQWVTFRPLLVTRFSATRSPAQKVGLISNLTQRDAETVLEFYDRVANAYYEALRERREALAEPNRAEKRAGFDAARNELFKYSYVSGLKRPIREQLEATMTAESDPKWLREKASTLETALSHQATKKGYAAPTVACFPPPEATPPSPSGYQMSAPSSTEMEQFKAFLAFTRGHRNSNGSGGAGGNRQATQGDPNAPRQPMATEGTRRLGPMRERGWVFCHRCGQWGLHIRAECKLSVNQLKTTARSDSKTPPTSTPTDAQYPNC